MDMLQAEAGLPATHMPRKGAAPANIALIRDCIRCQQEARVRDVV